MPLRRKVHVPSLRLAINTSSSEQLRKSAKAAHPMRERRSPLQTIPRDPHLHHEQPSSGFRLQACVRLHSLYEWLQGSEPHALATIVRTFLRGRTAEVSIITAVPAGLQIQYLVPDPRWILFALPELQVFCIPYRLAPFPVFICKGTHHEKTNHPSCADTLRLCCLDLSTQRGGSQCRQTNVQ